MLCLLVSLVFAMSAYAASGREMYENGLVSDDGIPHGDLRDGIVTDASAEAQPSDVQNSSNSGVALAILVAVLVAIAVIVIIFVIMPKLK